MISFSRIVRDYDTSGALHSLIGVHQAVSDHVFLTKRGDLLVVARLEGLEYEGLDAPELNRACRQFESALKTLGEGFRLYQYVQKRATTSIPHQTYPELPVVNEAIANRVNFLSAKDPGLHTVELYWVLLYERGQEATSRAQKVQGFLSDPRARLEYWLSAGARSAALAQDIASSQDLLLNKARAFLSQLDDGLRPTLLDKHQCFGFLRSLLNYGALALDAPRLKYDDHVDYQICGSALECHRDHLRLGDAYVQVLTLKEPPSQTYAHLLRRLQDLPSQFVIASEWKAVELTQSRRAIQMKRRHFHNTKISVLPYLANSPPTGQGVLVDDAAAALVQDLGHCLEEIDVHGKHFGQFSLTVALYDHDRTRLKRSVAECVKVFGSHDAQLLDERYNLLNAFLAIIPGNQLFNLRRMWLLSTNSIRSALAASASVTRTGRCATTSATDLVVTPTVPRPKNRGHSRISKNATTYRSSRPIWRYRCARPRKRSSYPRLRRPPRPPLR